MEPASAAAATDSISSLISGGGLVIGGAALAKLIDAALSMWRSRHQRTEITPQPLEVREAPAYVRCEDCIRRHAEVDKRHGDLEQEVRADRRALHDSLGAIRAAIVESDRKAEERSRNMHKRIDPLVTAVAQASTSIDNHLADHRAKNA